MKTGPKLILALLLFIGVYAVLAKAGLVPGAHVKEAEVPKSFDLPSADAAAPDDPNVTPVPLPSTKVANVAGPKVRINVWAWNAQMGLIFANGGPETTSGSLMEKHKVKLEIVRQDDTDKSKADQLKFASELAKNPEPTDGIQFVLIMGDGAAQYLAAMNKELSRLGKDYQAEIIASVGYSRGEDAFMGPKAWKDSPEAMKGGLVAGVLRDGDWNIAQYYAAQNNIKNNPDEHTWDADALNWVSSDDYMKAVETFVSGACEDRDIVVDGKKTGQKNNACVQGVVSWTPGDVSAAKKKGGVVKILSTKENIYQMPAVIIGIHKWDTAHHHLLEEMLTAAFEGGDQMRHFDQALQAGCRASYAVYKEESADYWCKYYKGAIEKDKTGVPISLGGSIVSNLADNMLLFGLSEGSGGIDASLFKATYEGFGNISKQQYPKLVPSFPSAKQAVDTSYVEAIAARTPTMAAANVKTFEDSGPIATEDVVAKKNWNIQFDTGKSTVMPSGQATLTELYNQLIVGGAMAVEIQGHTDDVGDPKSNQSLSEQRAFAVRDWLQKKAPTLFPANRISVEAFGQSQPLVPNTSVENRAKNRRVTIILGAH